MKWFFIVIVSCHVGRFKEVVGAYLLLTGNESNSKTCVGSGQRMLTCFVRGHINVQLTCCFICWDSAPFLMLNWQQIYLFGRIQTSQTECHTCLYKWVSIVWFGILEFIQANWWSFPQIWTIVVEFSIWVLKSSNQWRQICWKRIYRYKCTKLK